MPKQGEKAGCKECRHFEPNGTDGSSECHLHPPTVIVQHSQDGQADIINSAFPGVQPDDWCSHETSKETETAMILDIIDGSSKGKLPTKQETEEAGK